MVELTALRRINFGCGYDKREGYLNVDSDPACQPDVLVADGDYSIFPTDFYEEVFARDVLEHIPRTQTLSILLDWAEYLVLGGTLRLQTSSIGGVAEQLERSPAFADQYGWTQCLFGSQAHPGDFHFTGFTETTLRVHVLAAGFQVERMWVEEGWLLNLEATKAESWSRLAREMSAASDEEFIQAIYRTALHREADGDGLTFLRTELKHRRMDRRQAIRHLMVAPERLYQTAAHHAV
jgi:predicted SAM-dependent methyltransferase